MKLTGSIRYRETLNGKFVLQVEERTEAGTVWRDARKTDLAPNGAPRAAADERYG